MKLSRYMDLEPTKMPTGELECLQTDLNPVGPGDLEVKVLIL